MRKVLTDGYIEGTVAHLLVLYFEWCVNKEKLATRTRLKYQQTANRHILPLLGGIQVSCLTTAHLGHADTRMTMRHYAHLAEHWRAADAGKHAPRLGLTNSSAA